MTIYFNNKLLRGNRATKVDAGAFDAFHTPNLSPLAELEIDIHGNQSLLDIQMRLAGNRVKGHVMVYIYLPGLKLHCAKIDLK